MYRYRRLTEIQKQDLIRERRIRGLPLHAPPHYPDGLKKYLLTAATLEHRPIIDSDDRRKSFVTRLLDGLFEELQAEIFAWAVLPNHYHLLISLDLKRFAEWIRIFHSGIATEWNRFDGTPGRRVWYRFVDRAIRSERHFFASINYIHNNPVRHGYVPKADNWACSSIHEYLEKYGRDSLVQLWKDYPVDHMGDDWDT